MTLATYMEMFLSAADIEANSKETYARHLTSHVIPYIGKQRVAEVSRETIHRLLVVVLNEKGASQTTILHTRTALSAMLHMAWDNGYRKDNPVRGIKLKGETDRYGHEGSVPPRLRRTSAPGREGARPGGDRCPGPHR